MQLISHFSLPSAFPDSVADYEHFGRGDFIAYGDWHWPSASFMYVPGTDPEDPAFIRPDTNCSQCGAKINY